MRHLLMSLFFIINTHAFADAGSTGKEYMVEVPGAYMATDYIARLYSGVSSGSGSCFGDTCYILADEYALQKLKDDNIALSYEENYTYKLLTNDTEYPNQWELHSQSIGWEKAGYIMDRAVVKSAPIIAVIDTGYTPHEDMNDNIYDCYSISSDNCTDYHGHGTHIAGVVGAVTNNNLGIASSSYGKVFVMPVKTYTEGEGFSLAHILKALELILEEKKAGANIVAVNASFGTYSYSSAMYNAIDKLKHADILLIAAAGNDSRDVGNYPHYPSGYDLENIISVAALKENLFLASFSNYSPSAVHIAAPGVSILSLGTGSDSVITDRVLYDKSSDRSISSSYPVYNSAEELKSFIKTVYNTDTPYGNGKYSSVAASFSLTLDQESSCAHTASLMDMDGNIKNIYKGKIFQSPNPVLLL